ncbi:MAG: efflux RND transporter permease subunit [Blastocatellia bacterium]|nr:efflux RND transporter permease subunit [Blastocatellia bacterium]
MTKSKDQKLIEKTQNSSRYFVENRQVGWVLLILTIVWGTYSYFAMPQRKDPEVPVRQAAAITLWSGVEAEKVEQLVTKKIEAAIAENEKVTKITSVSRTGISVVYIELDERLKEIGKELDDVKLKLDSIKDLPEGVEPINFIKDFGDTTALMLTVASPKADSLEIEMRAKVLKEAISKARKNRRSSQESVSILFVFPNNTEALLSSAKRFKNFVQDSSVLKEPVLVESSNFFFVDGSSNDNKEGITKKVDEFLKLEDELAERHPDMWKPVVIYSIDQLTEELQKSVGDKYSYREMDDFTEKIEKAIKSSPLVAKISRYGVLPEKVYLKYSQQRLASYGIQGGRLKEIVQAQNISQSGGTLNTEGRNLTIQPTGEFKSEKELSNVLIPDISDTDVVYLRDLVDIERGYENPARYLNFYNWQDSSSRWQRSRAITFAINMRSGEKISDFGREIDTILENVKSQVPSDLLFARTSDQPLQVAENVGLFMRSLIEAVVLVVIISLLGFWEWRSALLMALSIPLTLTMTFAMMHAIGIDIQQVSLAALIIALGLLVDDPVVAGDAIKRELENGHSSKISSWLGPSKLATAILFATITNIVAYLPFLLLKGDMGQFLYSFSVVLTCSLVASRLVSMTFVPLIGYYLLRPKPGVQKVKNNNFVTVYKKAISWVIDHRWKALLASFLIPIFGVIVTAQLKPQFLPKDLSYLSYIDIWLPEDASLTATNDIARQVESIVQREAGIFAQEVHKKEVKEDVLQSLTTFIGGGGPRFWFTVAPELEQLNYAQIVIQVKDKHHTEPLIDRIQKAISSEVAGARIDVRQLESGSAVGLPVAFRIVGSDINTLRSLAEEVKAILASSPVAMRVRDDWGAESFKVKLKTDSQRANIIGFTNADVANSSLASFDGLPITILREGDKQIPVVTRLKLEERAKFADLKNLYIFNEQGRVPLKQVSSIEYEMEAEQIKRYNQFRAITVSCAPATGVLSAEVVDSVRERLTALSKQLPPGYKLEIAGEEAEQVKGFNDLAIVLVISVTSIFLALVFQFRHAIKPLLVFAAIPYGTVGAMAALWIMDSPFGFMGFLGVISLVGVIVSHVIVLFDFIEEAREEGMPLRDALIGAGILRLRPVLITVGATVFALFPLAINGGPLWEPLCYAQIGGLTLATVVTLIIVPVIYAIAVMDLKLIKWKDKELFHS